jgi:hypothetical protein
MAWIPEGGKRGSLSRLFNELDETWFSIAIKNKPLLFSRFLLALSVPFSLNTYHAELHAPTNQPRPLHLYLTKLVNNYLILSTMYVVMSTNDHACKGLFGSHSASPHSE